MARASPSRCQEMDMGCSPLHLAGQHQQVLPHGYHVPRLPHKGQLRACSTARGDSQRGLAMAASCGPLPPLPAWVKGEKAALHFGGPWGSKEEAGRGARLAV